MGQAKEQLMGQAKQLMFDRWWIGMRSTSRARQERTMACGEYRKNRNEPK